MFLLSWLASKSQETYLSLPRSPQCWVTVHTPQCWVTMHTPMLGHSAHPQCWVTAHTPSAGSQYTPMLGHGAHQRPGIRVGTGDPDSDPHASPKLALQPSSHWFLPFLPMALPLTFASSETFIKVFSQSEAAPCRACLECTVQPKQMDHISQCPCGDFYSMCV